MYILASTMYILEAENSKSISMNQYSGTKQKSSRRLHAEDGKFVSDYPGEVKRLRSIRLTDTAWELLAEIAEKNHITRTEVIEMFVRGEDLY
jgi:hypothetical protein